MNLYNTHQFVRKAKCKDNEVGNSEAKSFVVSSILQNSTYSMTNDNGNYFKYVLNYQILSCEFVWKFSFFSKWTSPSFFGQLSYFKIAINNTWRGSNLLPCASNGSYTTSIMIQATKETFLIILVWTPLHQFDILYSFNHTTGGVPWRVVWVFMWLCSTLCNIVTIMA